MQLFRFQKGFSPILVTNAHSGTIVLPEIAEKMTDAGLAKPDTAWALARIFDVQVLERAAVVTANLSRYVIDLDKFDDDRSPATGAARNALVPTETSKGEAIYQPGVEIDAVEITKRIEHYFLPFHVQVQAELERLVECYSRAVLVDLKATDDPEAADVNFGTLAGIACGDVVREILDLWVSANAKKYSASIDQTNFTGGGIVQRYHGIDGVEAIQITLKKASYLDPDDGKYHHETARELLKAMEPLMGTLMAWAVKT
jgi:N-formylglutamate deformylase